MPEGPVDWMAAAKCCGDPGPVPTFADLPRQDQREIVRVAVFSAAAAACFVTLGILTRPIPSRNLLAGIALPHAPAPRPALLDARRDPLVEPVPLRPPPVPTVNPRASYERAAVRTSASDRTRPAVRSSGQQPRGGFFSRFFRRITGGGQPGAAKADTP